MNELNNVVINTSLPYIYVVAIVFYNRFLHCTMLEEVSDASAAVEARQVGRRKARIGEGFKKTLITRNCKSFLFDKY